MTKKFHRAKFLGVVHLMQPFYVKGDPEKKTGIVGFLPFLILK